MAMLHPRYNHLGRSKKSKSKPSKAQEAATVLHNKFLLSHGVTPKKRVRLKGAILLDSAIEPRQPNIPPLSNSMEFGYALKKRPI